MVDGHNLARTLLKGLKAKHSKFQGIDLDSARIKAFESDFHKELMANFGTSILPELNESSVVAPMCPELAAIFFDRVWWCPGLGPKPPDGVAVYGATQFEIWTMVLAKSGLLTDTERFVEIDDLDQNFLKYFEGPLGLPAESVMSRAIARSIGEQHKTNILPMYSSLESASVEYVPGDRRTLLASIRDVGVIDQDRLTWDHVLQIRDDKEALMKLRRMRRWLDSEMVGKPVNVVADEIAIRLDDYEWAIKKHGLSTIIGSLHSLLDPKFLAASASVGLGMGIVAGADWGAIGVVSALAGRATVSLAEKLLNLEDERRGAGYEVAFIRDLSGTT